MRGCSFGLVALAVTGAVPAFAQDAVDDSIVVSGSRMTPEEIRRGATDYVKKIGVANGERAAARWRDPVCPRAIGLAPKETALVEARVRDVARAAGAPVAQAPCEMNIAISFTRDAGTVVREVARRSPRQLEEVPRGDREALLEGAAPVRWWYLTDTRSKHGMRGETSELPYSSGNGPGGGSGLPPANSTLSSYNSSMISTQATRVLTAATVVVDVEQADGRTLDAISSYAALVALAEIRAGDAEFRDSILGLFQPDQPTESLTDMDLAFLRGLYRIPLDRTGRRHRSLLVGKLIEAAEQP